MKHKIISAVAIFVLEVNSSSAGNVIDVLFVFDDVAQTTVTNKEQWVEARISLVNLFLSESGNPTVFFNASVSNTAIGYNAANGSSLTARNWMIGSPLIASIRGSNDLVILVAATFNDNPCGRATPIPNIISPTNSNSAQYAVIQIDGCDSPPGRVLAHELGHLLYAEHQVSVDANGNILVDGDESGNHSVFSPAKGNHGYIEDRVLTQGQRTLMADPAVDGLTVDRFSNGGAPYDSEFEDVVGVMGVGVQVLGSWGAVSRYRDPPPLVACDLRYEFAACSGTIAIGNVTAFLPGYTVTLADFDFSINSGGSWSDLYTGLVTCPGAPVYPTLRSRVRATLTTAYGVSQCEIPITINNCEGSGSGRNPF